MVGGWNLKINSSAAQQAQELYRKQTEQPKPPTGGGSAATGTQKPDRADISTAGRLKAQAMDAVAAAPDTRADLVNSLRSQVQSGTYQVNEQQLASHILNQVDVGA
jgi:flagellar biosynthesis anti-sigma factor FlgM